MDVKFPRIEDTSYFTVRKIKDENGNEVGRVIMYRLKGKKEFTFYMLCPRCKKESVGKKEFKRRPYRVECKYCGYKYTIEKIRPKK